MSSPAVYRTAQIMRDPCTGDFLTQDYCYVFAIANSADQIHVPCAIVTNHENQLINSGSEIFQVVFSEEDNGRDEIERDDRNEGVTWPEEPTKLLISLYRRFKPMVEQSKLKTLKRMWENIKFDMAQHGHMHSITQIENKWKSLERSFKNKIEHEGKTGRGRKNCLYEKELSEILLKRHSINPTYTLGSNQGSTEVVENENPATSSNDASVVVEPLSPASECGEANDNNCTPIKRRRTNSTTTLRELQELKKTIIEKNKIKLETEQIKSRQRDEFIAELRKQNTLLEKLLDTNTDSK